MQSLAVLTGQQKPVSLESILTPSERHALEQFDRAAGLLRETYVQASDAGLDPKAWEAYSVAREQVSAAGHLLFRLSLRVRTGQSAEIEHLNAETCRRNFAEGIVTPESPTGK